MFLRVGYWRLHPYHRLSVRDHVEEWVGWQSLMRLVNLLPESWVKERAFIATLFETGGRVSEVLMLKASNFEIRESEGLVIIRNMPLLKRYRKIAEKQFDNGRRGWITVRVQKARKPFPILMKEPLAEILVSYVRSLPGAESLLFPSPRKPGQPLSRFWAYKLVRILDSMAPDTLKANLGLIRDEAAQDRLHLWLHWFRAQRACQLVSDYGFELHDLIDWFSWEHLKTALTYSRKGWKGLAVKMLEAGSHAR